MLSTKTQIDLNIHRLKRHQYQALQLSGLVDPQAFYYITDDQPTEDIVASAITSALADYTQTSLFKTSVSGIVESYNFQHVYQNDVLKDLYIYKLTRAEYQAMQLSGLIYPDRFYFITDDPSTEDILSAVLSNYYAKSETSSAAEISVGLETLSAGLAYDISAAVEPKADVSAIPLSVSQLSNDAGYAVSAEVSAIAGQVASKFTIREWSRT